MGHPVSDDPLASQRAELIGKLAIAQFDLENALAEVTRNGASTGPIETQLQNLGAFMRQVGVAGSAALAGLRGDIAALVAHSGAIAQQARTGPGSSQSADAIELAAATRDHVNAVMRGMKDFDPYLEFDNAEAEADYRRREAERRAYIEAQQAKGTPESDLNAAGAAMGQMADAGAHGAANSPEFDKRRNALADSTQRLRDQLVREGKDVSEFDNRLRDDLRQIMRAKGKSDAEIDTLLAAHPDNPMDAMRAFVAQNAATVTMKDLDRLDSNAKENANFVKSEGTISQAAQPLSTSALFAETLNDVGAELKALGVGAADLDPAAAPSHGVAVAVATAANRGTSLS